jgi:hypothetical protein
MSKKSILVCLFTLATFAVFAQLRENVGIGVRLQIDSTRAYKIPVILALVPNGSAQSAGLHEGDFILEVDEQSTRDIGLQDVVNRIVGEEGSNVNLLIERDGSTYNYNIERIKYKYADIFYQSAVTDNDFCTALTILMNDAPYDFNNTSDTTKQYAGEETRNGGRYFESKIVVPGADKVFMVQSLGASCIINFGPFANTDEVNSAAEEIISKIQICFPDYYYNTVIEKTASHTIEIGKTYPNGFEAAIMQLYSIYTETEGTYTLTIRVNGGKATRYYKISTPAQTGSFANALRTIFNDIPNNYSNIKGTEHEIDGGLFSVGSSWFEVSPVPDGAHDCSISEGGLTLGNGCNCRFYSGESHEAAVDAYKQIYDLMYDALGSEFVFSFETPSFDMSIPNNTESIVVFGIKTKHSYESIPLLALLLIKDSENHFSVNMLFHDSGF